jgi:hypothetical protein
VEVLASKGDGQQETPARQGFGVLSADRWSMTAPGYTTHPVGQGHGHGQRRVMAGIVAAFWQAAGVKARLDQ